MYETLVKRNIEKEQEQSLKIQGCIIRYFHRYLLNENVPYNLLTHFTSFAISRMHKSLMAYRSLVESELLEDARTILRTMVELVVTYKYIAKSPEERVRLFLEYDDIICYELLLAWEKHDPEVRFHNEQKEYLAANYAQNTERYPIRYHWSKATLANMAKEAGMTLWYETLYMPGVLFDDPDLSSICEPGDLSFDLIHPQRSNALSLGSNLVMKSCQLAVMLLETAAAAVQDETGELEYAWKQCSVELERQH